VSVEKLPIITLCFRFYGESFDPDEITRRLELTPTSVFRPGDPITKDGRGKRRRFGWRLKVKEHEGLDMQDLLQEFKERISVSSSLVRQVCTDLDIQAVVFCGVRQRESEITPALEFPMDFVEWVGELGASIDVDVIL
jgi:hypothetical protein